MATFSGRRILARPVIFRNVYFDKIEFKNAQHVRPATIMVKPCSACEGAFELSAFPESKNTKTGKASVCNNCMKKRVAESRAKKKEREEG